MAIYELDIHTPKIDDSAWVADNAQVMGEVEMAAHSSVWFSAVVRGDSAKISIGEGSNVQDGSVLHTDTGIPLVIGKHVTVGHMVQLHGCTIGSGTLIGMQAIVLNNAKIGRNCLIGAGAIVPEGREIPDGSLVIGVGKITRTLSEEEIAGIRHNIEHYAKRGQMYRKELKRLG